jgi:hypothetical protein
VSKPLIVVLGEIVDNHGVRPDFLFAAPSWLSGIARTLDLAGQFDEYNDSPNEDIADARAMFCDWRVVGDTIVEALIRFRGGSAQAPES